MISMISPGKIRFSSAMPSSNSSDSPEAKALRTLIKQTTGKQFAAPIESVDLSSNVTLIRVSLGNAQANPPENQLLEETYRKQDPTNLQKPRLISLQQAELLQSNFDMPEDSVGTADEWPSGFCMLTAGNQKLVVIQFTS